MGRGGRGSLCKSLWAHAGEAVLSTFTWTTHSQPPCLPAGQGEKECLRAVSLGGRFSSRQFPGDCSQDLPLWHTGNRMGQRENGDRNAAVTKASAPPQLGWSLKGVWAFICTHCGPSPSLPMSHGIWAVPGQGGSVQLRAILERDEAVNRLLPTRPGAERTSLRW